MDAKETLAKLPLSGSLFVIALAVAFFLCFSHDQKIRASLYDYHGEHLLKTEAPIYNDFYSKRLAIEQIGSRSKLQQFRSARQQKQAKVVSHLILLDRSFRPYLNENSQLFFTTKEAERWRNHNEILTKQLNHLSIYQFGLIPEQFTASPQFSRLLTYLLVDTDWLNLASNSLLMLCLFILLEPKIQRSRLWAAMFSLSILHSSLYLLFADALSSPLTGSNMLVYFLSGLAFSKYLRAFICSRKHGYLYLTLAIVFFLLLKSGFDVYYGFIFSEQIISLILAMLVGGWLGWPGSRLIAKPDSNNEQVIASTFQNSLSADHRTQYHEALTALTRFNFAYARSKLRQLTASEPSDIQLLESSYHLEKLHPEEGFFWPLVEARIEQVVKIQDYPGVLEIFKDIQISINIQRSDSAGTPEAASQCIGAHYYLQMLIIFLRYNNIDKAEHAFKLLEMSGNKQIVKDACQLLIEHFASKKLSAKQSHYQMLYDSF